MQTLLLRFRSQQIFLWKICGETFYSSIETPCWCPSGWAPTWRLETETETAVTEQLLQKLDVIARGTQKQQNNTFLIQELFR